MLVFGRRRELVLRIGHLEGVGLAGGQALEVKLTISIAWRDSGQFIFAEDGLEYLLLHHFLLLLVGFLVEEHATLLGLLALLLGYLQVWLRGLERLGRWEGLIGVDASVDPI